MAALTIRCTTTILQTLGETTFAVQGDEPIVMFTASRTSALSTNPSRLRSHGPEPVPPPAALNDTVLLEYDPEPVSHCALYVPLAEVIRCAHPVPKKTESLVKAFPLSRPVRDDAGTITETIASTG